MMVYTKKQFINELKKQCDDEYDILKLSRWAHEIFLQNVQFIDEDLKSFIMLIVAMDMGAEFELSRDELMQEAEKLLSENRKPQP